MGQVQRRSGSLGLMVSRAGVPHGVHIQRTVRVQWTSRAFSNPSMAAPSHRHQSSLEGLIDFSAAEPLFSNEQERAQAVGRFRRIVGHFEAVEQPSSKYGEGYNRPALVRLTFEYARSQESKDRFLGAFFRSLAIGMLDDDNVNLSDNSAVADFREAVFGFAEFLVANFFLPRMSISQPTSLLLTIDSTSDYEQDASAISHLPRCCAGRPTPGG